MRIAPILFPVLAAAAVVSAASPAFAFGGSATQFDQDGNFVVTNQANLGFQQSLNSPTHTSFTLAPALDYFVIPHLSVGGQVLLSYAGGGGSHSTTFGLVPEVGYDIPLGDTWSFWPRVSLSFTTTSFSSASGGSSNNDLSLGIFTPFLVHPAEHFFFGLGPGFTGVLAGPNPNTAITVGFVIGGYFRS
jgi:hypothetical protein